MIEFLPIKIESTLDWSLIFTIVAGIAFFFGKLINEVSPYKENKYAIYVSGVVYVVLFIIFPPLVLYTIFESRFLGISYWLALAIHFILTWYLGKRLYAFNKIQRMKLDKFATELADKKTKAIMGSNRLLKRFAGERSSEELLTKFYFGKMPHLLLFLLAILNYWLLACVLVAGAKPILIFLSGLFLLITMSCLAVFYARADVKYPQVTVHLDNGEKIEGELTKIDEGFINVIGDNRVYHILDGKVNYIEVVIITEDGKQTIEKKVLGKNKAPL